MTGEVLRALLSSLIDYAGLYPPAALSMREAVAAYARHRQSADGWALGKFITPAARLREYEAARAESEGRDDPDSWPLSVLLGEDVAADCATVRDFDERRRSAGSPLGVVEAFEVKASGIGQIERIDRIIKEQFATTQIYYEIPIGKNTGELLAAIKHAGGRAKVRTGGVTADAFPKPTRLLNFIDACAAAGVPFKATAGLHHPLRGRHNLTYEPDSESGVMHGFVNVFLAAAFRWNERLDEKQLVALLEDASPKNFQFAADAVRWRDNWLSAAQIEGARAAFAVSFGSCSFDEPLDDLRHLNLL